MEPLSPAELRALYVLARFETATEAAEFLHLAPQTLRNQSFHAFKKLGVNGRIEAFRKLGWLRPPQFMPSPDDPFPERDLGHLNRQDRDDRPEIRRGDP